MFQTKKFPLLALMLITSIVITSCSGETSETGEDELEVFGAVDALDTIDLVVDESLLTLRPSASLGVYVSLYLAQGIYLPARTALAGIDAQWDLITGFGDSTQEENFVLLEELGQLLQVDVPDMLNRSTDRPTALNEFIDSLREATRSADQKRKELEVLVDEQEDNTREARRAESDIEKEVRTAVKDEDYGTAGALQQDLVEQKGIVATAESELNITRDILDSYEDLIDIAVRRLNSVDQNRDALLAGVNVIDVPGIDDLRLIEKARRGRRQEQEILEGL